MTYFLSPGPRSWIDSPGISPAISMIPAEPERCSASPEMAWMDTGVSSTFVAFSLLAVTVTSSSTALSAAVSAAAAMPGNAAKDRPTTNTGPMSDTLTDLETLFFWLVIIVDAGIVPGADHTNDIDAVGGCCLERVELLARQENHIPCRDPRFLFFRPHVTLAGQYDDRLLVQVAMRCCLGRRYVADELGNDVGSDPLVHEDLEVARAHRGTLVRIHGHYALFVLRLEVGRHGVQPRDLSQRAGKDKHLECLTGVRGKLDRFRRADVHPIGRLHRKRAARDRDRAGPRADEQDHIAGAQADERRGFFARNLHQQLSLVERAHLGRYHVAVAQGPAGLHRRKARREYVAAPVQERAGAIAFRDDRDIPIFGTEWIVERRPSRKVRMGTVTKRCITCMFTATQEQLLVLGTGRKLDGTEVCPLWE